jgi:galactonate dehydratase
MAPYTRGRVPSVPLEEHIDGASTNDTTEFEHSASEARLVPGLADRVIGTFGEAFTAEQSLLPSHQIDMGQSQLPHLDQVTSRAQSSRNSPEPSQTDLQGHYVCYSLFLCSWFSLNCGILRVRSCTTTVL